ncbi:MAG: FAD:protein FMN transferase [Chloroflexota bacterium]
MTGTTDRTFRAMNTEWWIAAGDDADLDGAEALVHEIEARLSRFRQHSALSRLNRERVATDPWLAEVVSLALEAHVLTDGAFDIRVAEALALAGYDRSFELIATHPASAGIAMRPACGTAVTVRGDTVRLDGRGSVDLGGVAKGWAVDRVAAQLAASGATSWFVDGGGDLRAAGLDAGGHPWLAGAADGQAVRMDEGAVCTSSTLRRRWPSAGGGVAHHIIDPASGLPAVTGVTTAVVVAEDAATADMLATAVIASPARGLAAVHAVDGEAMVEHDGRWEMTPGMGRWLA